MWFFAIGQYPLAGDRSILSHRVKPEGQAPREEVLPLLLEWVEERTVDIA
jgi:hypothetical protein